MGTGDANVSLSEGVDFDVECELIKLQRLIVVTEHLIDVCHIATCVGYAGMLLAKCG